MRIKRELILQLLLLLIYFGGACFLYVNYSNKKEIASEFLEKKPLISDMSGYDTENRLIYFNDCISEIKELYLQLSIEDEIINERIKLIEKDIANEIIDNKELELRSLIDDIYKPIDAKREHSSLLLFGYPILFLTGVLLFRLYHKGLNKYNAQ